MDAQLAGKLLREARQARAWSARELARRAGISEATVRYIEHGHRPGGQPYYGSRRTLAALARVLGVPLGSGWLRRGGFPDMADQVEREAKTRPDMRLLVRRVDAGLPEHSSPLGSRR